LKTAGAAVKRVVIEGSKIESIFDGDATRRPAPRAVVGTRKWTPTVSADGVHSLQTTLRPSALVRGSKA
jgi:hypothetical protein